MLQNKSKRTLFMVILVIAAVTLVGCSNTPKTSTETQKSLSGEIKIDGSSTVFPVTEAVAEEFVKANSNVRVPVGVAGTGGGFTKFIAKEIDIANASRAIKTAEADKVKAAGIEYVELPIGFDGLSVLVNPANTWVDKLTVDELKKIWAPDSKVKTWKDVRPEWPAEEIKLYSPGTDSGTFDYFTEAINGKAGAIRQDFTGSEDDNVLVQGIAGDKNALGYFGFAYYEENKSKLKVVPIDNGKGVITPSFDTIKDGSYAPLSRPLYIYVNKASLAKPEVKEFVNFYLKNAKDIVAEVGYVSLPDAEYTKGLELVK